MSGWISVKDKLPDLDQIVIIRFPSGYDGSHIYAWGGRTDDGDGWCWGRVDAYGGMISLKGEIIDIDDDYPVTHWQPLPEPPLTVTDDAEAAE